MRTRRSWVVLLAAVSIGCPMAASTPSEGKVQKGPCPPGMAFIQAEGVKSYCIDRWEASIVEVVGKREAAHAPFETLPEDRVVKAVTKAGVVPQGYISKNQAEMACKEAGKRLCTGDEWVRACRGKNPTTWPYGDEHKPGYCNDVGQAPFAKLFPELGGQPYSSSKAMNDPRINQSPDTVAKTGAHDKCKNGYGVFDMVGNLHEWTADVSNGHGTFRGGYYQDTHLNGDGCKYKTVAHDVTYHDYSTGFRCCADAK